MRRQLPAHSPLSLGTMSAAAVHAMIAPGRARQSLKEELGRRFRADRVRLLGSGTQALQMALIAATRDIHAPLVAIPGYTCYDVASAALGAGVGVTFYDLDPATLAPEPSSVSAALGAGAHVLVVNTINGFPVDWDALRAQCRRAEAVLIEDSAQGTGSGWRGLEAGSFGELSVFSFGRGKGWTGGGGGALLARGVGTSLLQDEEPSGDGLGMKALVMSVAQWSLSRPSLFGIPASIPALHVGETLYKEPAEIVGMAAIPAGVLRAHAPIVAKEAEVRRAHAARWQRLLAGLDGVRIVRPLEESDCGYLRFVVVAEAEVAALLDGEVAVRAGVTRGYPIPLADLEPLQRAIVGEVPELPGARLLAARLYTLPTHSMVSDADFESVQRLLAGG